MISHPRVYTQPSLQSSNRVEKGQFHTGRISKRPEPFLRNLLEDVRSTQTKEDDLGAGDHEVHKGN